MHDFASAEAYCMHSGEVVSTKVAQSMVESIPELEPWVSRFFGTSMKSMGMSGKKVEQLKKELLRILFQLYLDDR